MAKLIKQVIVVEGKTDTQKLQQIFGEQIKTIETKGLAIDKKMLKLLDAINIDLGIVVFTDPDGPGKKIRELINQSLSSSVLNAFIHKDAIDKNSKKIGVAEASNESIAQALENLVTFSTQQKKQTLTWQEYLENDFYQKKQRVLIARSLGWDENLSSKTMFKWLNWSGFDCQKISLLLGVKNGNYSKKKVWSKFH